MLATQTHGYYQGKGTIDVNYTITNNYLQANN